MANIIKDADSTTLVLNGHAFNIHSARVTLSQ